MADRGLWAGALVGALLSGCGSPESDASDAAAWPAAADLGTVLRCLDARDAGLASAHRAGGDRGIPENTAAAIDDALSHGPMLLEVDVRATADGVLVLVHDDDLSDGSDCDRTVSETPWRDLAECRLRDEFGGRTEERLLRLEDALAMTAGRAVLQLDVKRARDINPTLEAVRSRGAWDQVIFIAYRLSTAQRIALQDRRAVVSAPIRQPADLDRLEANGVDLDQIVAWAGNRPRNSALLDLLERRSVPTIAGVLGEEDVIERLIRSGVDVIVTDAPGAAVDWLESRTETRSGLAACVEG